MAIDYHNRVFRSIDGASTGDVSADTRFHYRQDGDVVWGTYSGGGVKFGTLTAIVLPDGRLDMRYSQVSRAGALKTGRCVSLPEILPDGRVRLNERWEWTEGGVGSGESVVEELPVS